jgi:hypothetical protein
MARVVQLFSRFIVGAEENEPLGQDLGGRLFLVIPLNDGETLDGRLSIHV